jgi:hypothetical protein
MKRIKPLLSIVVIGCAPIGIAGAADSDEVSLLQKQLAETRQSVEDLTERVRQLEAMIAEANLARPAAAPAVTAVRPAEEPTAAGHDHAMPSPDEPGLPLHGFADVSAGNRNPINPDLKRVAIGNLDFYLAPPLGDRTAALFELNFKVATSGDVTFDIERAQFGYQFSDAANVWLGRFHTPYGYYNTAFHHGAQMTTALRRPLPVQFEKTGGVMPAHTVGAWFTGSDRLGGNTRLTYDVYAGNAERIKNGVLDVSNGGNSTGDTIVGGNVGLLAEEFIDGLRFGISAFSTKIQDDLVPSSLTRVNNYGVYLVHETDRWENIAEYYTFANDDLSGSTGTHRSEMGFIQFARRIGDWTPYGLYERGDFDQTDKYFAALRFGDSYRREAVGARYDLDITSALKVEFAQTRLLDRMPREYDEALLQYAIRF